ncbi:MAG: nucleoside monophosphate kinase [Candidatus Margulisiibacteriota bacterium]
MNILVFLGPAGSGKGTQAQVLKDQFNYVHLSTGDLLREEVKSGSELGQKVQSVIHAGNLVSDDIILDIIRHHLKSLVAQQVKGVIFDGFPRTLDQANAFNDLLAEFQLSVSSVLYFNLSLDESIIRISGRQVDARNNKVYHKFSNPAPEEAQLHLITRKDDTPEKVTHRYNVYIEETSPLLSFYGDHVIQIDCLKSIQEITNELVQLLESFQLSR